jgi:hypothetical protein
MELFEKLLKKLIGFYETQKTNTGLKWSVQVRCSSVTFCNMLAFRSSSRSSVSEEHLMSPAHVCLSVCLSRFSYEFCNLHYRKSLLEHTVATMWIKVIVGTCFCNNMNRAIVGSHLCNNDPESRYCNNWISLLPLIPLLHLPFPWLPCWRQRPSCGVKNTWNLSVLQRVHVFNLVMTRGC